MKTDLRNTFVVGAVCGILATILMITYLRLVVGPREVEHWRLVRRRQGVFELYLFALNLQQMVGATKLPLSDPVLRANAEAEFESFFAVKRYRVISKDMRRTKNGAMAVEWRIATSNDGATGFVRMWVLLVGFADHPRENCLFCAGAERDVRPDGDEFSILLYSPAHQDEVFLATATSLQSADSIIEQVVKDLDPEHSFVEFPPWIAMRYGHREDGSFYLDQPVK